MAVGMESFIYLAVEHGIEDMSRRIPKMYERQIDSSNWSPGLRGAFERTCALGTLLGPDLYALGLDEHAKHFLL